MLKTERRTYERARRRTSKEKIINKCATYGEKQKITSRKRREKRILKMPWNENALVCLVRICICRQYSMHRNGRTATAHILCDVFSFSSFTFFAHCLLCARCIDFYSDRKTHHTYFSYFIVEIFFSLFLCLFFIFRLIVFRVRGYETVLALAMLECCTVHIRFR